MIQTIKNEYLEIKVKDFGAELCSLVTQSDHKEYMWEGDNAYWGKQAPILFPVIGCTKNGVYTYHNKVYNMPKHGFARDMEFNLIMKSEESLVFKLVDTEKTLEMYPFEFELLVTYELKNSGLRISYKVINRGVERMYFSLGAHPAFASNINTGNKYLEFEKDEPLNSKVINLENGLIDKGTKAIPMENNRVLLSYDLFSNDALVFSELNSKTISIVDGKYKLKMNFDGFPYLGIWSKPGPFVCLEPWYGIADPVDTNGKLEEKQGIQSLMPNKEFKCCYDIEIETNFYEDASNVDNYINMSTAYDGRFLVDLLTNFVGKGSKILELGIGPGKDMQLLKKHYDVTGSDYSAVFVSRYKRLYPEDHVVVLDAKTLEIDMQFDVLYSNKVLQHLATEDLSESIKNQASILKSGGIVFHSFWFGDGEEVYDGLRFVYYNEAVLRGLYGREFEVLDIGRYKEEEDNDSIYIIAKKR